MKIPYIKLYTADLLAASRHLTAEQLGEAILGICESAFENNTLYEPETTREKDFFAMLNHWKDESADCYRNHKKIGRKGGRVSQQKNKKIDGSEIPAPASSNVNKHTETETKTETDTETEKYISTAQAGAAQGVSSFSGPKETADNPPPAKKKTQLQLFSNEVLAHFEQHVVTDAQKGIWFKRNCRCLRDILNFCEQDIPLALRTIQVCILRLKKSGLTGGYEAVCRFLPDYYAQAKVELEEEYGYTK